MDKVKRSWDLLSKEDRQQCTDEIMRFFEVERGEKIGIIGSEEILDVFLQVAGTRLYNLGVKDAISMLKANQENLEIDMGSLLKDDR